MVNGTNATNGNLTLLMQQLTGEVSTLGARVAEGNKIMSSLQVSAATLASVQQSEQRQLDEHTKWEDGFTAKCNQTHRDIEKTTALSRGQGLGFWAAIIAAAIGAGALIGVTVINIIHAAAAQGRTP